MRTKKKGPRSRRDAYPGDLDFILSIDYLRSENLWFLISSVSHTLALFFVGFKEALPFLEQLTALTTKFMVVPDIGIVGSFLLLALDLPLYLAKFAHECTECTLS